MQANDVDSALKAYWQAEDPDRTARAPIVETILQATQKDPGLWRFHRDDLARTLIDFGQYSQNAMVFEHLAQACEVLLDEEGIPDLDRALCHSIRSNALWRLGEQSDGDENLHNAVKAAEAAINLLDGLGHTDHCGRALAHKAVSLWRLSERSGDRETFDQSIATFDAALDALNVATAPIDWAKAQDNRANTLRSIGERFGDREAFRKAIAGDEQALTVWSLSETPVEWARAQMNRAGALRSLGELAGDGQALRDAIAGYDADLEVRTREAMPADWAMTQNNRAAALESLGILVGDRETLHDAIAGHDAALEVHTREAMPSQWARIQNNRAGALKSLGELTRDPIALRGALAGFDAALEVCTREAMPTDWAATQNNRANALERLGELAGDGKALREAVDGYDSSLEVYTREAAPTQWAVIQMNRANTLTTLGGLAGDSKMLRDAVAGFDAALEVCTREAMQAQWAMTQLMKAFALNSLGELAGELARFDEAADGFVTVLDIFTAELAPDRFTLVSARLAKLLFRLEQWAELQGVLDQALAETAGFAGRGDLSRSALEQAVARVSGLAALRAWLALGAANEGPGTALRIAERGRARMLALGLAPNPLDGAQLTNSQTVELQEIDDRIVEAKAAREWALKAGAENDPAAVDRADDALNGALQARRSLLADLGLLPDLPDRSLAELLAGVPEGGAVALPLVTSRGAKVIVAPAGRETLSEHDVIDLPGLDEDELRAWIFGTARGETGGYAEACNALRQALEQYDPADVTAAFEAFDAALHEVLSTVWEKLLAPVDRHLCETIGLKHGAPVVLMPPGLLAHLPLGASGAFHRDGELDPDAETFGERWTVSLAPCFEALIAGQSRRAAWKAKGAPMRCLGMLDPDGTLPLSRREDMILTRFLRDPEILKGNAATRDVVLAALARGPNVVHCSTHGFFDVLRALQSGLVVADGRLVVDDLIRMDLMVEDLRLVNLSACESGLAGINRNAEEFVGLPTGFLQAGAMAALATHWPIEDRIAYLLAERFFEAYLEDGRERRDPAEALAIARRWLRTVTVGDLRRRYAELRLPDGRSIPAEFSFGLVLDLAAPQDPAKSPPPTEAGYAGGHVAGFAERAAAAPVRGRVAPTSDKQSHRIPPQEIDGITREAARKHIEASASLHLGHADDDHRPFARPATWAAFAMNGR